MSYRLICPNCDAKDTVIRTTSTSKKLDIDSKNGCISFYGPGTEVVGEVITYSCSSCKHEDELLNFKIKA